MMSIKAGEPLITLTKLCYRADLPLMVMGGHGVGKSEILKQAAQELGIDFVVFDLSLMEPTDLIGLPRRQGDYTVYCPPKSLPTSGKGLLVFEELNRAPLYMRAPCLQLLTARRLNDYLLPAGWLPVAAVNPPEQGYEVDEMDAALLSRFVKAFATADREEWLTWARGHGVHPVVIGYVQSDESVFDARESNPRAWAYVSDLVHAAGDGESQSPALQIAVSGIIGRERAGSFLRFLAGTIRPLNAEEIFSDYGEHRGQFRGWVNGGKLDLVQGSLLAVKTRLQSRTRFEVVQADRPSWKNLALFLTDLPGDLREEAEHFFSEHDYPLPKRGGATR